MRLVTFSCNVLHAGGLSCAAMLAKYGEKVQVDDFRMNASFVHVHFFD